MVRSMYSGVAGMKAHQTKMDVIGNNIANVNTYGFKASRATFRDMYYQSIQNASAATANRGGINPSSIGYGSSISSVDVLMTQSSMISTGNPLDVAITGEGFLQVMDNDGNIFYTKAGMLDIDAAGNLIDTNGYFVLGTSGDPLGQAPGSSKIQFTIPPVSPKSSSITEDVNGIQFSIQASNQTKEGNVSFMFQSVGNLPVGKAVNVILDGSNITVQLNATEQFASIGELQDAINSAITEANNGTEHPAGMFQFSMDPDGFSTPLTGEQIAGKNFGYTKGSVATPDGLFGGFNFVSVGDQFSGTGTVEYSLDFIKGNPLGNPATENTLKITADVGGETYSAEIKESQMSSPNNVVLYKDGSTNKDDSITLSFPTYPRVISAGTQQPLGWSNTSFAAYNSTTPFYGGFKFTDVGANFAAAGGVEYSLSYDAVAGEYTMSADVGGTTFTATFTDADVISGAALSLVNGADTDDCINLTFPSLAALQEAGTTYEWTNATALTDAVPSEKARDLGLSAKAFKLVEGTEGGPQSIKDLTGIAIGADGSIVASHGDHGLLTIGRIDLATFDNPRGLQQTGNSYFSKTENSGDPSLTIPGENGSGALKNSALEMSNVDLAQEFSDMITTQRGFQASSRLITVSDTMLEELINLKR